MSDLSWTASGAPRSSAFDDIYFNPADGAAEAEFVFVTGNRLAERFAALPAHGHFRIAELGFGTGLNLLCAWRCFEAHAPAGARLTFLSTEALPLKRADLSRAHQAFPDLQAFSERLVTALPPPLPGLYAVALSERVRLLLWIGDAAAGLAQWLPQAGPRAASALAYDGWVDAWFFDGFAPAKNPAMWTPELLALAGQLCRPGATCATFTSAGAVRRALAAAGFEVAKIKGYGSKREMTVGRHGGGKWAPTIPCSLWWRPPPVAPGDLPVAVIGAGLAGCHTAAALAAAGYAVVVYEAGQVAGAASGNPRALLYARFSPQPGVLADFNLAAYTFAESCYACHGWRGNGLLQAPGAQTAAELQAIALRLGDPDFARWLAPEEASARAGAALPEGGLWLPAGGALDPRAVCRQLLANPRIELREAQAVTELTPTHSGWRLQGRSFEPAEYAAVVLCNAGAAQATPFTSWLPLGAQRGQVTLTTLAESPALPICGDGYLIPTGDGHTWLGATYAKNDLDLQPRAFDDDLNRARAIRFGAGAALAARAGIRATLPDYLPVVGPVPQMERFTATFEVWRRNAKARVDALCPAWPGLYVNCGHGSRGVAYAPAAAALLVAYINGEPLPLAVAHATALSPGRFLKRALTRGKNG